MDEAAVDMSVQVLGRTRVCGSLRSRTAGASGDSVFTCWTVFPAQAPIFKGSFGIYPDEGGDGFLYRKCSWPWEDTKSKVVTTCWTAGCPVLLRLLILKGRRPVPHVPSGLISQKTWRPGTPGEGDRETMSERSSAGKRLAVLLVSSAPCGHQAPVQPLQGTPPSGSTPARGIQTIQDTRLWPLWPHAGRELRAAGQEESGFLMPPPLTPHPEAH